MPRYVCCLNNKFFEFSSVVEAPVTGLMTEKEFREYYQHLYGEIKTNDSGAEGLDARMERARKYGTSSLMLNGRTFDQWLEGQTLNTYKHWPGIDKWKADYFEWAGEDDQPVDTLRDRHNPVDGEPEAATPGLATGDTK